MGMTNPYVNFLHTTVSACGHMLAFCCAQRPLAGWQGRIGRTVALWRMLYSFTYEIQTSQTDWP
jgi:hypothetical protein